jgi:DNA-binding NarL/FixJ family response regulator
MAFRGLSRWRASAAKPPGESLDRGIGSAPTHSAFPTGRPTERDELAVDLLRSGMTYLAIAEALGIREATARRAVLDLDRTLTPLPPAGTGDLPERSR